MSDAGLSDAASTQPAQPFALPGARRCTPEELRDDTCAQGSQPGACLDEQCVTEATCDRYCEAKADHDVADCRMDPSTCEGVAECVSAAEQTNRDCAALRAELLEGCRSVQCALIRTLPSP